jgi:hypothetical protein
MNDEFEALLERIRQSDHPDYGVLAWDGQRRRFSITVTFERVQTEPDEVVRRRALRYLEALSPEERELLDIDVAFRDGKPVRATLHTDTGMLSTKRLRELSQAM